MTFLSASVVCASLVFCALLFQRCGRYLYQSLTSPLRMLPGPKSDSILTGNLKTVFKADFMEVHEKWVQEYGDTHAFHGIFNMPIGFTADPRAVNYILTHTTEFQKAERARRDLARLVGSESAVLVAEGEQHRRLRRVMNPAFGPLQIRELTSIFFQKSIRLRECWTSEIGQWPGSSARIDVLSWIGRATLDVIGLAGFNYAFEALTNEGSTNELSSAFNVVFESVTKRGVFQIMQSLFPPLRAIQRAAEAQAVMRRIGLELIADKKADILSENASSEKQGANKGGARGRDLLTLLIKANMATDAPESQRMNDEEVLAQIATFIVAGHETISTATTWCLFALTQAPEVQQKLRHELLQVSTDTPAMDELAALPYLDMVVKESLRIHPSLPMTDRTATVDTYIPLSKPLKDKHGQVHERLRVAKGDPILIPILMMNQSKTIWGEDALDFKPERWENPPEAIGSIPGVWANLMTFLGGPRSCIGYRFAVIEMKALLFTLVRAFEFELAVPVSDVKKRSVAVTRPFIASEEGKGNQMPLRVKPYD